MIRATTPTHKFVLPFDYASYVKELLITYRQGNEIILEKDKKASIKYHHERNLERFLSER